MTTLGLLVDALLFKWENLTLKTSYPYYHERQASSSMQDFESVYNTRANCQDWRHFRREETPDRCSCTWHSWVVFGMIEEFGVSPIVRTERQ